MRSIKANFIINIFLSGSAYILPFLAKPYVSRILMADGMGKVSFATSQIAYFTMFAMLGVPTYGIRACARVRDDENALSKTVTEIFTMNLLLSIPVYFVFVLSLGIIPKMNELRTLHIVMSISILLNVIGMDWLYRGIEAYASLAVRSLVVKLIALILIFLLIHNRQDYIIYGFCTVIASYGANLLNFWGARRYLNWKSLNFSSVCGHFKPTLVFFAMSVATTIYTNLDVVMLGFMTNDIEVGYYDATLTIKLLLISVVSSLGAVLLPRVSYYIQHGLFERFYEISRRAMNCILLLAIPLTTYFFIFARNVILLFSGNDFDGAILPMKILIPTILLIGITNITGIQMLVPLGKEKIVLYSEIGGAIVDLVINWILIPDYGAIGAAVGTLIAEFVVLAIQFYALKDKILGLFIRIQLHKIICADIAAGLLASSVLKADFSGFLIIIISGILFFGVYGLILLLTKEIETMSMFVSLKNVIIKLKGEKKNE